MKNPILEEIYETRQQLLAESGGTLAGLVQRLQADQEASGRQIVLLQAGRTEYDDPRATRGKEAVGR